MEHYIAIDMLNDKLPVCLVIGASCAVLYGNKTVSFTELLGQSDTLPPGILTAAFASFLHQTPGTFTSFCFKSGINFFGNVMFIVAECFCTYMIIHNL